MNLCICVYRYMYMYIHTHTHRERGSVFNNTMIISLGFTHSLLPVIYLLIYGYLHCKKKVKVYIYPLKELIVQDQPISITMALLSECSIK